MITLLKIASQVDYFAEPGVGHDAFVMHEIMQSNKLLHSLNSNVAPTDNTQMNSLSFVSLMLASIYQLDFGVK